jgi:hypothetical protein
MVRQIGWSKMVTGETHWVIIWVKHIVKRDTVRHICWSNKVRNIGGSNIEGSYIVRH